jgi:signal peptidase
MSRRVRKVGSVTVVAALIVVWAFTLRPQVLGGPAVFVAVRGSSMLPTYEHGDLVVVQSAAAYEVGEVVAYRVPAGEVGSGRVVIHRIVGGDATHGFTLQGDHNSAPDPWHPKQADMVGIAAFRVSNAGRLFTLVQQPVILAGLASAIVVMVFLARPAGPTTRTRRVRRRLAG